MSFDPDNLEKLTRLSRIKITPEEEPQLLKNLSDILGYVDMLNEAPVEGVATCDHVLEAPTNSLGEDEEADLLERSEFLELAPEHKGGMVTVPEVINFEEG